MGRSPGSSLGGRLRAPTLAKCKDKCQRHPRCKAITYRDSVNRCFLLPRFYEGKYQAPGVDYDPDEHHHVVVANFAHSDFCWTGIFDTSRSYCCDASCGTCGGAGCENRRGGAEGCC